MRRSRLVTVSATPACAGVAAFGPGQPGTATYSPTSAEPADVADLREAVCRVRRRLVPAVYEHLVLDADIAPKVVVAGARGDAGCLRGAADWSSVLKQPAAASGLRVRAV
jgi:hypothetical protein